MLHNQINQPAIDKRVLELTNVSKVYQSKNNATVQALNNVSFSVNQGDFLVVIGSSGSGKTTLLNVIAGFEEASDGLVLVDGKPVHGAGPDRMVMFQDHALFPWLSVKGNVMFGLNNKKSFSKAESEERADYFLDLVGLSEFSNAYIHQLSGGMKQRVALARALAPQPRMLLMDEPFSSLDVVTREELYQKLQEIFIKTKQTVLFVTHNVREAACLGDRVMILASNPGRIATSIEVRLPRPRDISDPEVSRYSVAMLRVMRSLSNNTNLKSEHETRTETDSFLAASDLHLADGI